MFNYLSYFLKYNIITQILIGFIIANLILVSAKNRLNGFISLLSFATLILLFLNATIALLLIYYASLSAVNFVNEFALGLYFILHLIIVLILGFHISLIKIC